MAILRPTGKYIHFEAPFEGVQMAAAEGSSRQDGALKLNRQDRHGLAERKLDPRKVHVQGAIAEYAASLFFGERWNRDGGPSKGPDVGTRIQVRSVDKPWLKLIMRPDREDPPTKGDNPDDYYVLVQVHLSPVFVFVGWMQGHEIKRTYPLTKDGIWEKDPAWLVPPADLHPFPLPTNLCPTSTIT